MATETPGRGGLSNRAMARLIGAGVLVALFVVFVLQNRDRVRVHILFWDLNASLAWSLIIAGILGILLGLVLPRLRRLL